MVGVARCVRVCGGVLGARLLGDKCEGGARCFQRSETVGKGQ